MKPEIDPVTEEVNKRYRGYLTSEMGDPTFRIAEIPCSASNQAIGSSVVLMNTSPYAVQTNTISV